LKNDQGASTNERLCPGGKIEGIITGVEKQTPQKKDICRNVKPKANSRQFERPYIVEA
jgi:hypothetical protein